MKRGDAFPSKYLSKEDIPAPISVTIARVFLQEIDDDETKKTKAVVEFNGLDKSMILNATNWDCLETAFGQESDAWIGKTVQIYVDPSVMFKGEKKGGLRLRISNEWTFAEAVAAASEVKLTEQEVKDIVKQAGGKGWVAHRDTPIVKAAIEEARNPL